MLSMIGRLMRKYIIPIIKVALTPFFAFIQVARPGITGAWKNSPCSMRQTPTMHLGMPERLPCGSLSLSGMKASYISSYSPSPQLDQQGLLPEELLPIQCQDLSDTR